jgi:hypothetical protein
MRYLIETENEKALNQLNEWSEDEIIEIIHSYDKFEKISNELQEIKSAIDNLKKNGYSLKILRGYCRSKGVSGTTFDLVFRNIEDFFKLIGLK